MKRIMIYLLLVLFFLAGVGCGETGKEWFNKGNTAFEAKNYDEAISMYKKAIAINPDHAPAHYNLGKAYRKKGMPDEAITEFKKAIAINPDDAGAHYNLGKAYGKKGMTDEAISTYKKAIAIKPDHANAHNNLGKAYRRKGNLSLAADYFYKAGLLFLKRDDRERALKTYDSLKKTNVKELEQALFDKLYPELKQKQGEPAK